MRIEHLKNIKHHKTIRMNSGWSNMSYDLEYRYWVTPVDPYKNKFHPDQSGIDPNIINDSMYYVLNIECVAKSPYEDQDPGIPTYILEDWIVDNILDDAYDSLVVRMNLDNIVRLEPDRKGGITLVTIMDPENNRAYHTPSEDLFNNDTSKFVWRNQLWKKHAEDVRRHNEDPEEEDV
jgi:hypothetical protein